MPTLIVLIIVVLVLSGFFSGNEAALSAIDQLRTGPC